MIDVKKLVEENKKLKKKEKKEDDKKSTLKSKIKIKRVFKPSKMEVHIKERTPAPYVPIFWKNTFEKEKRSMFFE